MSGNGRKVSGLSDVSIAGLWCAGHSSEGEVSLVLLLLSCLVSNLLKRIGELALFCGDTRYNRCGLEVLTHDGLREYVLPIRAQKMYI